jgi:multisubunit Na+/H+ antiporter MnhC subunit
MNSGMAELFRVFIIFITLLTVAGLYCVIRSFNLVRALIGVEILLKVATLFIILAGYLTGNTATAQSLVMTLIVIEVVVMVVAGGFIVNIFRHTRTISSKDIMELKG